MSNGAALLLYLEKFEIDAARVLAESVDESGYDYIQVSENGRPVYDTAGMMFRVKTERRVWPEGVWPKVERLIAGAGLRDIGE